MSNLDKEKMMGVVYKLLPEIKDYIITAKQEDFDLSCRRLVSLISERFSTKVSKSSINSLIKEVGLSMPVGRRKRKRRGIAEGDGLGVIFLTVADAILSGNKLLGEIFNQDDPSLKVSLEQLFPAEIRSLYPPRIQGVNLTDAAFMEKVMVLFQEVRCINFLLSNQSSYFIDGQSYTIWPNSGIPFSLCTTTYDIRNYINNFSENKPLVLFMAPGYDIPPKELFEFILASQSQKISVQEIILYGLKAKEIEKIAVVNNYQRPFVLGLWPWQFTAYRKIRLIEEFKEVYFEPLKADFFVAEVEVELSQPSVGQNVTLRGCALKRSLNDKIQLIILSNLALNEFPATEVALMYLNRWPNLEKTFQDFSRKVELFGYTAASDYRFSLSGLEVNQAETPKDVSSAINYYLQALDLYSKWYFLPFGWEKKDFPTMKQLFYSLKCRLKKHKNRLFLTFLPPENHTFLKELSYACDRVNERNIILPGEKRLWLNVKNLP